MPAANSPFQICSDLLGQAIARQPMSNQGIVVRPDRTVVITHGIVAAFGGGDGSHAPAGEQCRGQERRGHARGTLGGGDAREQAMSGVGRPHAAGPLIPIEGQGIAGQFLAPEGLLEPLLQLAACRVQLRRPLDLSQDGGQRPRRPCRAA